MSDTYVYTAVNICQLHSRLTVNHLYLPIGIMFVIIVGLHVIYINIIYVTIGICTLYNNISQSFGFLGLFGLFGFLGFFNNYNLLNKKFFKFI